MKRIHTTILVMLILGLLLSCSKGTSKQSSSGGAQSAAQSASSPAKRITIKLFTGKIETIDVMNEIINAFNTAQDRVTVEQEYQRDASNIIKIKFASGEAPDIMTTYEQEFVDQGKYLDLSGMNEWWNRLPASMKDSCTDIKTGKQYRICTNVTMAGFFYNKALFDELGLSPAENWTDFTQNLQVIQDKKSITPWFIFGKEAWHLGHLIEFMPHGYIKESLGAIPAKKAMLANDTAKLNFGAPDGALGIFAANLMDLKNRGLINRDVLTATSDNCVQDFVAGKAAMFSNGMWALGSILDAAPEMANYIGFAPYPAYMSGSKPVVLSAEDSGYAISATTAYPDACKEFLSFLFNAQNQKRYSETAKAPSAFLDVTSEWAPQVVVAEVDRALKTAVNIGFTNEKPAGFSGDDAGRMVQDLLSGAYTPAQFAKAYETAWNAGIR
jgi:raffinose/stachyose/melibiose transport system substrate-binding protein